MEHGVAVKQGMTDEEWARVVLEVLAEPVRAVGMGDPNVSPRYILWHRSASSPVRPCPDSPVRQQSGGACYDVIVQEYLHADGSRTLNFSTEATEILACPAPPTFTALAQALSPLTRDLDRIVRRDFQRFETHNGGYLPGAEPPEN